MKTGKLVAAIVAALSIFSILSTGSSGRVIDWPTDWIEPSTGHRIIRLSKEPGTSSFYFHQNGFTAEGDKLIVSSSEGLSAIDMATLGIETRGIETIVAGRVSHAVVGRKTRQVFYIKSNMHGATHVYAVEVKKSEAVKKSDGGPLAEQFLSPPDDSRIMMRWWWFGPSVTKREIERELRLMKEAGIGGVEVQAVYPLSPDAPGRGIRNLPFLSDEFIDALQFASEKAHELGLRVDLTLGSGWPYGGPQVPIEQAAGKLRLDSVKIDEGTRRVRIPVMSAGEKLVTVSGGGPNELLFFIASRTGMMVKRAAVGAEGYVLDHYDGGAVEAYARNVGDRLMRAFKSRPPYSVFCDSLEVYEADWTGDLLDEFRKRRGYDLRPHLPALVGEVAEGQGPSTLDIRHDWGKTLSELVNERFVTPMEEWARRQGTRFRIQGYGTPPATLSSSARADLPEGEGWQWKTLRASRWAASASHLYGRPVTSSETWTWLHSPVFRASPLDIKAEADRHFLQGINQLIGHGWPYTAEGVEYPGWRFYAAGAFDEKNPWWIVMPDVSRYLQRVSFMLRQGQPVNDVALYLPNSDAWAHFSAGHVNMIDALGTRLGPDVVASVLRAGFNLDFFDDEALEKIGRVERGALALGTNRYRVVILPGVERIPLETLRKLGEFARGGGVLVATRRLPGRAPGFLATDSQHGEVRAISDRLFQLPGQIAAFIPDEKDALESLLTKRLRPDVSLPPANRDDIGFVHRRTEAADIYFLANTSNLPQRATATFRVSDSGNGDGRTRAEWWDPMNGGGLPARTRSSPDGGVTAPIELEPYGSRILVLSNQLRASANPTGGHAFSAPAPIDLSGGWSVSFGGDHAPAPILMDRLRSWTESEETRYYSGLATYEKTVSVPENMVVRGADLSDRGLVMHLELGQGRPVPIHDAGPGMQAWLDAPVREAAVVYVNGKRAGPVWCPPYRVEVTGLLKPGENSIRIVVGNLAINDMAGRELPAYRLLNQRYGVRFEAQDMDKVQPVPAGLLGPIQITATPRAMLAQ